MIREIVGLDEDTFFRFEAVDKHVDRVHGVLSCGCHFPSSYPTTDSADDRLFFKYIKFASVGCNFGNQFCCSLRI
jgi:hypothetical protein